MAINPLQIPSYAAPQALDFTPLANLGNVYKQGVSQRSLAELGNTTGPIDYEAAARAQLAAGNVPAAMSLATLGATNEQRQYQRGRDASGDARQMARDAFMQNMETERLALARQAAARAGTPAGFQQDQSGGLRPIAGGPADPAYKRTVTDRQNAPPGYKWADPSNPEMGLVAIPGGPGEKVPAEVAARLGLAKSFLGQLYDYTDEKGIKQPGLRSRIEKGEMTGLVDGLQGVAGVGEPGSIKRKISSGAEALLRNLTGAGMNIDEAKKYVSRYEPQWNDSAKTLLDKVDQLARELRSVNDVVSQGRGGSVLDRPSATRPPAADKTDTAEKPKTDFPPPPRMGELRGGYRFKGGNPGDPASWVKAQDAPAPSFDDRFSSSFRGSGS